MGIIEGFVLSIIASIGTTSVIASNLLYIGMMAGFAVGGSYLLGAVQSLFVQKPSVPKPEDGSYNFKQNVPQLSIAYGTVKKGGDYVFLEEKSGTAYHIIVWSGRRINSFTRHYLHDKAVTLDGDGYVTAPSHFDKKVLIESRVGANASTAYSRVVSAFPTIWTNDHRGDGLATVMMACKTVDQEKHLKTYPNQMPEHSAVGEGALLYDPRKDSTQPGGSGSHRFNNDATWEFSRNLALIRLDHLTKPYGGKMSYTDMYLPDWMHAANVADQFVVNRNGTNERRYHGGMWFRTGNDPVEVGRQIDDAGEMVIYERWDGLIGVHAGEFKTPTVTLNESNIRSIKVDKNRRKNGTVLAVRGRWVNRSNHYMTEDAAIFGNPYGVVDDNSERTKTYDNVCIQSHNHCQRKQKLTLNRSNARKVTITADYIAAEDVAYSRFVFVNYPSRGLVNAVIEVVGNVSRDFDKMLITFGGVVTSMTPYAFDAATEEGAPGAVAEPAPNSGVPTPVNFTTEMKTEVVTGGGTAAYALAKWDFVDDALSYELEWEPTGGTEAPRKQISAPGNNEVRSTYLVDGHTYRFRLRAWGGGSTSEWTAYQTLTATADPVAPGPVSSVTVTEGTGQVLFEWNAPNSANYYACRIYIGTTNVLAEATLAATEYGPPSARDNRTITSLTAGTYYAWLVAINPSGKPASAVATGAFTVT